MALKEFRLQNQHTWENYNADSWSNAGLIQTAGRTLEEIEQLLRDALASELRDPDVDVVLSEPAPARCEPCSIAKAAGNR